MAILASKFEEHAARYNQSHRDTANRALHFVGIPALMVAALGAFSRLRATRRVSSRSVFAGACLWYARWDVRAAAPLGAFFTACHAAGRRLSSRKLQDLFVFGAVCHLVGHYAFEHKPPLLLSRPMAILEAPAWLLEMLLQGVTKPRSEEAGDNDGGGCCREGERLSPSTHVRE